MAGRVFKDGEEIGISIGMEYVVPDHTIQMERGQDGVWRRSKKVTPIVWDTELSGYSYTLVFVDDPKKDERTDGCKPEPKLLGDKS